MEKGGEKEMRPEKPLNIKSISGEGEGERRRVKCREFKILKKDTASHRRIKKESSDDCDIDDSTVGKWG